LIHGISTVRWLSEPLVTWAGGQPPLVYNALRIRKRTLHAKSS
jgi:hypothetical protein